MMQTIKLRYCAVFVFILLQILLFSCIPGDLEVWKTLPYDHAFALFMGISDTENDLWVTGRFFTFADRIWEDGKSIRYETVDFPKTEGITQFCVSDKIWVFMSDMNLIRYDPKDKSQVIYSQFKDLPEGNGMWPSCTVTKDKLIIWRSDWVGIYTNSWDVEMLPATNPIAGIAQDPGGILWLILNDGTLYQKGANGWVLDRKLQMQINDIRLFTITADNVMWIGAGENLYRWPIGDNSELKVSLQQQCDQDIKYPNFIRVITDEQNGIFIVADCWIWNYTKGVYRQIMMPPGQRSMSSAAYDEDRQRLYIGTGMNIYYLDLK